MTYYTLVHFHLFGILVLIQAPTYECFFILSPLHIELHPPLDGIQELEACPIYKGDTVYFLSKVCFICNHLSSFPWFLAKRGIFTLATKLPLLLLCFLSQTFEFVTFFFNLDSSRCYSHLLLDNERVNNLCSRPMTVVSV